MKCYLQVKIINMNMAQNFDVLADKFNKARICTGRKYARKCTTELCYYAFNLLHEYFIIGLLWN
jgi:hypothetical protein